MKTLQFTVDQIAESTWDTICESYPKLVRFNPPKIVLCNRLTRTAGKNYQEENLIHLGNKFFAKNSANMRMVILPHEIAHQADFNLFGISEKKCGHGVQWQKIMLQLGLAPNKYHSMEL
jgi:predicted SprT family Zn-dependent metalloprotease